MHVAACAPACACIVGALAPCIVRACILRRVSCRWLAFECTAQANTAVPFQQFTAYSFPSAAWQLARQAAEVDELTAAADKAAAAAAAAGGSSAGGRDVSDVDAELAALEGQQRQVEAARDELMRRQGRIKVWLCLCAARRDWCSAAQCALCRCMHLKSFLPEAATRH